jgi:hypothetical protein
MFDHSATEGTSKRHVPYSKYERHNPLDLMHFLWEGDQQKGSLFMQRHRSLQQHSTDFHMYVNSHCVQDSNLQL